MIIDDITNCLIQQTIDDGGKVYVFNQTERFEVVSAQDGNITIASGQYEFNVNDKLSFVYLPKYKTPYVCDHYADTDGDGIIDLVDLDADGDGVIDPRAPIAPTGVAIEIITAPSLPTITDVNREPIIPVRVKAFERGVPITVDRYYPLYLTISEAQDASPIGEYHEHYLDSWTYYMPVGVDQWHGNYHTCKPDEPTIIDTHTYNTYDFQYVDRIYDRSVFGSIIPRDYRLQLLGFDSDENGTYDSERNYSLIETYNSQDSVNLAGEVEEAGEPKYNYYRTNPEQAWVFQITEKHLSEDALPNNHSFALENYVYKVASVGKFDVGTEDNAKHTSSIFKYFTQTTNGELATFDSVGGVLIIYPDGLQFGFTSLLEARADSTIVIKDGSLDVGQRIYLAVQPPPIAPSNISVEVQVGPSMPNIISVISLPAEPSLVESFKMPVPYPPSDVRLSLDVFGTTQQIILWDVVDEAIIDVDYTFRVTASSGEPVSVSLDDPSIDATLTYSGNNEWVLNSSVGGGVLLNAHATGNEIYAEARDSKSINVAVPVSKPSKVTVGILVEPEQPEYVGVQKLRPPNQVTPLELDTIPLEPFEVGIQYTPLAPTLKSVLRGADLPGSVTSYRYDSRPAGWMGGEPSLVTLKLVYPPNVVTNVTSYRYDARPAGWFGGHPSRVSAINLSNYGLEDYITEGDLSTRAFRHNRVPLIDEYSVSSTEVNLNHPDQVIRQGYRLKDNLTDLGLFYFDNEYTLRGDAVFNADDTIKGWYVRGDGVKPGTASYQSLINDFGITPEDIPEVGEHGLIQIAYENGQMVEDFNTSWRIFNQVFLSASSTYTNSRARVVGQYFVTAYQTWEVSNGSYNSYTGDIYGSDTLYVNYRYWQSHSVAIKGNSKIPDKFQQLPTSSRNTYSEETGYCIGYRESGYVYSNKATSKVYSKQSLSKQASVTLRVTSNYIGASGAGSSTQTITFSSPPDRNYNSESGENIAILKEFLLKIVPPLTYRAVGGNATNRISASDLSIGSAVISSRVINTIKALDNGQFTDALLTNKYIDGVPDSSIESLIVPEKIAVITLPVKSDKFGNLFPLFGAESLSLNRTRYIEDGPFVNSSSYITLDKYNKYGYVNYFGAYNLAYLNNNDIFNVNDRVSRQEDVWYEPYIGGWNYFSSLDGPNQYVGAYTKDRAVFRVRDVINTELKERLLESFSSETIVMLAEDLDNDVNGVDKVKKQQNYNGFTQYTKPYTDDSTGEYFPATKIPSTDPNSNHIEHLGLLHLGSEYNLHYIQNVNNIETGVYPKNIGGTQTPNNQWFLTRISERSDGSLDTYSESEVYDHIKFYDAYQANIDFGSALTYRNTVAVDRYAYDYTQFSQPFVKIKAHPSRTTAAKVNKPDNVGINQNPDEPSLVSAFLQ